MPRSRKQLGGQGFPKKLRIRKRPEYLRIQGTGRKISTSSFLAFFLKTGLPGVRFGITVSRRVGGAVVRNRVKRLLRETFRQHCQASANGFLLVVVAKPSAAQAPFAQVNKEVVEICRKATASR